MKTKVDERPGVRFGWAAATDRGKVRTVNEDRFVDRAGVFAVADGMGGHAAGDVASALAVAGLEHLAAVVPVPVESVAPAVARLNAQIRAQARSTGRDGMGTTLVAALWVDDGDEQGIVVVNVGDSRCYLFDESGFRRLTHDHSVVQELMDAGSITTAEAELHPDRHVVTRAIGLGDTVRPDFVPLSRSGLQRLVLCTDGVTGELSDAQLATIAAVDIEPSAAVAAVLDGVLGGPARDNATVLVVDIEWTDLVADFDDVTITGSYPSETAPPVEITAPGRKRDDFDTDRQMKPLIRRVPK